MKLPDGWRKIRLIDCGRWVGGSTPSKKESQYWNGSIPWASSQDIKSRLLQKTTYSLTEDGLRSSSNLVPANSLLMVTRSGILRHTFPVTKTLFAVAINQDIKALIPDEDFNVDYIQAVLLAENFDILKRCSKVGTTVESIEFDVLKSYSIVVPPLPEQRRIAEFLGTWDEAIEKLEQLIAAKEKRFHGLIQMLISGKKGQWATIRLGNLFSERNESNYPLGELLAITGERGVVRRSELDKVDSSSEDKSQYLRIYPGDIGYNTMRMWQGVCGVSRYDGIVSPAYTILVPAQNVNADFAVFYFKTPPVIHIFKRHSQGLVDDTLNLKYHHFSQIRLPLPELSEQNRIAENLTIAQNELNLLRKELAALQKQKRGLMQKLLTGTWRV